MARRISSLHALALASALLWGVIELLALFRSRRHDAGRPRGDWDIRRRRPIAAAHTKVNIP